MELRTVLLPEEVIKNTSWGGGPPTIIPATYHTYAPTLATVHNWLWGDFGILSESWHDGWLCPFHQSVGDKNMTCSGGLRSRCYGIFIKEEWIRHLPNYHRQLNKVHCYEWGHVLSTTYWDIQAQSQDRLLEMPDDIELVAFHILRRVLRSSGWFTWKQELSARKNERHCEWLKPIERRGGGYY